MNHRLRFAFLATVLALLALAGTRAFGATTPSTPSIASAIASAVERERKVFGGRTPVPGVLVGVWGPRVGTYVHAFGYSDLAKRTPLSTDDHFRIGSNTKTFVVTVLLQLVDEGKLKLDDPLSRFSLGVKIPNGENITVREVCEMRSGLFESYDAPQVQSINMTGSSKFDPRTLVKWGVQHKPNFAPGKKYNYSNTNYLILGLLVESLTKDTIENQIRKRILVPYGLHETSFPSTQAMPEPWAHGYGLDKRRNWEDVSGTIPVSLMWAAGAMISDMADMKRWVKLYATGATNGAATQRQRLKCIWIGKGNLSFGLGIGCSAGWLGYTGGLPGYNTAGYYFPATGTTIVAWVTLQAHKPSPGVANAIFRDIARIVTPKNVPFLLNAEPSTGRSGL